jgi:Spy/CpxP family protein refolding chaperone
MNRAKTLLLISFALAFCAGIALGAFLFQPESHRRGGPPWLTEELALTSEQEDRMKEIWSEVREKFRGNSWEARRELGEKRDRAVYELLTEEQKAEYDRLREEYEKEVEELQEASRKPVEEAIAKTKEVLTPEQYRKFEELRGKRNRGRDSSHNDHGPKPTTAQEEKQTSENSNP